MSHRIEIDDDVFQALLAARLLHESPSSVIRRLLPPAPKPHDVIPIQQPPAEDLRNAVWMLDLWLSASAAQRATIGLGENDIARSRDLLRAAFGKLAEPSALVIGKTQTLVETLVSAVLGRADPEGVVSEREARDIAAVVLSAQLEGR